MSEPALLQIEDLQVRFTQGSRITDAVKGVTFSIHAGETVALVGESGSGKSVSALSILKLLPYPAASHPAGKVLYKGEDLMQADTARLKAARGNGISMIFQEPMSSLNPLHTIERQIGETLFIHRGMKAGEARTRVLELLNQVGIREPEKRLASFPHELSGGQRQRVMIAMALANEPDVLIADEPTTALDVTVQAQILQLLKDLQAKKGLGLLFITHDLGIVRKMADRVCVMTDGEIVEQGTTEDIFANPQHAYTRHLLSTDLSGVPPLADDDAPVIASTHDLKVWFPVKTGFLKRTTSHIKAVDGVDLEIKAGQTLGVVGESGSGKTTLGLALMRMISSKGRIAFNKEDLHELSFRAMRPLRGDMQVVFQDPFGSLSPRMSVQDIVEEGLRIHMPTLTLKEREQVVADGLTEVGLDPATRHRYPHEFSGGQRQRISIARAMVLKPKFVMLDEPTSALDVSVQAQVVTLLKDLQKKYGLSYLFISHDLKVVRALCNQVMVMQQGRIVEHGSAAQIFDAPRTDYTKALMTAAFSLEPIVSKV